MSAQPKEADTIATPADAASSKEAQKTTNFSIAPIVADYLALKNALVADDDNAAANAGQKLLATLNKVDMGNPFLPTSITNTWILPMMLGKCKEHIGNNAGKIDHQREHLASLAKTLMTWLPCSVLRKHFIKTIARCLTLAKVPF